MILDLEGASMAIPIFLLLVTVPAVLLVCRTEQRTKRGCGRGYF